MLDYIQEEYATIQEYMKCSTLPRRVESRYAAAYWQQWQHVEVDIGEGWGGTTCGQGGKEEGEERTREG